MSGILVVDQADDWPDSDEAGSAGLNVVTAWDYLTHDSYTRNRELRVYNLCRSFAYQSTGYYVSLLAGARGHKALPEITTVQDLKLSESLTVLNDEVESLIEQSLARLESSDYLLNVYFGQSQTKRHERLARALFNLYPAPLLRARFVYRADGWRIAKFGAIALGEVPTAQREFLYQAAKEYFSRRRSPRTRRDASRYDLAVLVNPQEKEPPSNPRALKLFEKAAESLGFDVEFIDKSDYGQVAEFDALFIRETTAVNHHTYRFARRAAREGQVVVDDPLSILRATNKVFLTQLMDRYKIPQPRSLIVHSRNLKDIAREIGFPCVLKQPDSQFSRGVVKVEDEKQLRAMAGSMLERSDLIVAQCFEPTEYDWRIGVLDGEPLYACRYFMAEDHWQVVKRAGDGDKVEGHHETLAIDEVPRFVLDVALRAARAVGRGLYGVDLKQFGKTVKVIEVNDNPNIDHGVEDLVLGDSLYRRIMIYFLQRLENRART